MCEKKDWGMRLCSDYRELHKKTVQDHHQHRIPRIQETLENLGGNAWFSTLDRGKVPLGFCKLRKPYRCFTARTQSGSIPKTTGNLKSNCIRLPYLDPSRANHLHPGKLEFLARKWTTTEQIRDYQYYCPWFTVYTDNNLITYVLLTTKLNTTGLRWIGELSDIDFEIKYRPGKIKIDADSLYRIPGDFTKYVDSCTLTVTRNLMLLVPKVVRFLTVNLYG